MPDIGTIEILVPLLRMLFLSIVWAMFVAWVWLIWRLLTGQPVLPEFPLVPRGEPPWRAGTVLLVFLSCLAVQLVISTGYSLVVDKLPVQAADLPLAKAPLSHLMLENAVLEIVMLILVPVVASLTCGARLRDFGLSFDGWRRQATVGVVATLIAAPPVYAIQILAVKIWNYHPHPVQEMIFNEFSAGVGTLAVATAVILAPMFEELLFRGLLQSWLGALFERRAVLSTIHAPEGPAFPAPAGQHPPTGRGEPECEREPGPEHRSPDEAPTTLDSPPTRPPHRTWLAIVLTSLLFASVHAPQWPAPVPLFMLALVIGTVYHRTGSLIAAVFMHATFNGLSTVGLFTELAIKASQVK